MSAVGGYLVGVDVLDRPEVAGAEVSPGIWLAATFTVVLTDSVGQKDTVTMGLLLNPISWLVRTYPVTVRLTDEGGHTRSRAFTITINPEVE